MPILVLNKADFAFVKYFLKPETAEFMSFFQLML